MKKWIPLIVVGLIVVIGYFYVKSMYNGMVTMDESVTNSWANVESQYQRRADLIPNLVSTVKGYATHEQEVLEGVVQARAAATAFKIDPADLTEENMAKYQQAQSSLSGALSRLLMVAENYPELKANQNFLELQAQLEGTENRISVERNRFNEAVKEYNLVVRKFPNNLFAGMFGFGKKSPFQAEAGAEKAPEVKF